MGEKYKLYLNCIGRCILRIKSAYDVPPSPSLSSNWETNTTRREYFKVTIECKSWKNQDWLKMFFFFLLFSKIVFVIFSLHSKIVTTNHPQLNLLRFIGRRIMLQITYRRSKKATKKHKPSNQGKASSIILLKVCWTLQTTYINYSPSGQLIEENAKSFWLVACFSWSRITKYSKTG